jgi:hypothetical protein
MAKSAGTDRRSYLMRIFTNQPGALMLLAAVALPAASLSAQPQEPNIVVTGEQLPDLSTMTAGPESHCRRWHPDADIPQ